MKKKYQVQAITMHDGEAGELRALGIPVTTTAGSQDETEFEVELTDGEAAAVRAHAAVIRVTEV